jgi:hypothetical protein
VVPPQDPFDIPGGYPDDAEVGARELANVQAMLADLDLTDGLDEAAPAGQPAQLPILAFRDKIVEAIQNHRVVIIEGETGEPC